MKDKSLISYRDLIEFYKKHIILDYLLIIILTSLIVLQWFQSDFVYNSGDFSLPLNTISNSNINHITSSWNANEFGYPELEGSRVFKYLFFFFGGEFLNLNVSILERLFFILIYSLAGCSAYYFANSLIEKDKRVIGLVTAFTYFLNPFMFFAIANLVYALFPLFCGLSINALKTSKIKYGIYISIVLLIIGLFDFFALLIVSLPFLAIIFFVYLYENKINNISTLLKIFLIIIFSSFLLNLFYILPASMNLPYIATVEKISYESPSQAYTTFLNIFRLFGSWVFYNSYNEMPYVPYAHEYLDNSLQIIMSFSLPLLAFVPLLYKKKNKTVLIVTFISIIYLFIAKGSTPPLGEYYSFLIKQMPFLAVVRESYKFVNGAALTYSFLIGFLISNLLLNKSLKIKYLVVVTTLFIVLFNSWPVITGDVIANWYDPSVHGERIPSSYSNMENWLNSQKDDFRLLIFPKASLYEATTFGHQGVPTTYLFFSNTIIRGSSGFYYAESIKTQKFKEMFYNSFSRLSNTPKNLDKLYSLMNVKYILINNYTNEMFYPSVPQSIKELVTHFNNYDGIRLEKYFDQFYLYKISNEQLLPHIYTTDKYVITDTLNSMFDLLTKDSFIPGESILFAEDTLKKEEIKKLKNKEEFSKYNEIIPLSLNDSSFEISTWQRTVGDCCNNNPGIADIFATLSNDSSGGNKSLNLTSGNHCACVSQILPNFDKNSMYKINFDYKHILGNSPKFCILADGCNKCLITNYLSNSTEWKTYSDDLIFENCTKTASLYFYSNQPSSNEPTALYLYSNSDGNETTTNLYDDVRIEKMNSIENTTNVFNDSSFENETWQKTLGNCCNSNLGNPLIYASHSVDATDGKYSLNLTSSNHCACVAQTVSLDRTSCYNITFDYKHVSGNAPKFCLWKPELSKCDPGMKLESSSDWKTYSFTTCTQKIPEVTTNLYDNVQIEKVIISNESGYHPQISFKKINPTKYEVNIENATKPFFLVFSESYHPQWKAFLDKSFDCEQIAYYNNTNVKECKHEQSFTPSDISYLLAKPLSEDNHFTANGYANSWYIDPKDIGSESFTMTLYFLPQSYFYLGLIISGITFIVCIGYLIYDRRKNKEPEHRKPKTRAWNREWKPVKGDHELIAFMPAHNRQRLSDFSESVSEKIIILMQRAKDLIKSRSYYHYSKRR